MAALKRSRALPTRPRRCLPGHKAGGVWKHQRHQEHREDTHTHTLHYSASRGLEAEAMAASGHRHWRGPQTSEAPGTRRRTWTPQHESESRGLEAGCLGDRACTYAPLGLWPSLTAAHALQRQGLPPAPYYPFTPCDSLHFTTLLHLTTLLQAAPYHPITPYHPVTGCTLPPYYSLLQPLHAGLRLPAPHLCTSRARPGPHSLVQVVCVRGIGDARGGAPLTLVCQSMRRNVCQRMSQIMWQSPTHSSRLFVSAGSVMYVADR